MSDRNQPTAMRNHKWLHYSNFSYFGKGLRTTLPNRLFMARGVAFLPYPQKKVAVSGDD